MPSGRIAVLTLVAVVVLTVEAIAVWLVLVRTRPAPPRRQLSDLANLSSAKRPRRPALHPAVPSTTALSAVGTISQASVVARPIADRFRDDLAELSRESRQEPWARDTEFELAEGIRIAGIETLTVTICRCATTGCWIQGTLGDGDGPPHLTRVLTRLAAKHGLGRIRIRHEYGSSALREVEVLLFRESSNRADAPWTKD